MKILFVAAEVAPFVSIGGLSQVMYSLPRALIRLGHDVRIFTPKYGTMDTNESEEKHWQLSMEYEGLAVPIAHANNGKKQKEDVLICNVKSYFSEKDNLMAYFLENREYYELRANVFGYMDDHVRFALLSKGCLEWLLQAKEKKDAWWPDIIHCNDWHTGYLIELARTDKRYKEAFAKTSIVYTVHNFSFQGNFDFRYAHKSDKDDGTSSLEPLTSGKLQKQNALLRGILYADAINTVSPTHAIEVLTPEYAEGLENVLVKVRKKLTGILNGIDVKEFDPAHDPLIKKLFTSQTFTKDRVENKKDLQNIFGLPVDPNRPLLAIAGRLSPHKGWDLLLETLPHLFDNRLDIQLVVLGTGENRYRERLQVLAEKYPRQLGLYLQSDFKLSHKLFAGADMFLVPSYFEPGGIVALEALRFGSVPIVRRTGGLNDIIKDFDGEEGSGNGFSFLAKDPWAFYGAIVEALTFYNQPTLWKKLIKNCMSSDFSWDHAAKEYEKWYGYLKIYESRP